MTEIKERPILFSTEMVKALKALIKLMTRRINGLEEINENPDWYWLSKENFIDSKGRFCQKFFSAKGNKVAVCPYGKIGDRLWVRETLCQNGELGLEYVADNEAIDETIIPNDYGPYGGGYSFRNIPNIHMPKWASRIWLEITDVKVERLKDISEDDSISEGVFVIEKNEAYKDYLVQDVGSFATARGSFFSLWQSINGEDSFQSNPWVWVISFKVLSTTGKP